MIKAILFDADGVLLKKHEYFSKYYSEKYHLPHELMSPFFRGMFIRCQQGKADLKKELEPYVPQWKWQKSIDEFVEYWFRTDVELDPAMVAIVDEIRAKGIKCYIASDQEKYRAEYLGQVIKLDEHFDGVFYSYLVGHQKSELEYFEKVLKKLGLEPGEVLFWDDDEKNVEIAKSLGMNACLFKHINDVLQNKF